MEEKIRQRILLRKSIRKKGGIEEETEELVIRKNAKKGRGI